MNIRLGMLTTAVAGILLPSLLFAQTVTTQPLDTDAYCIGETISVDFTVSGTFNPGNAMILQLSDPNGSFTTGFRNMKSISTTSSGTIEVTVPNDIPAATGYRFRVIASNPEVTGSDNGTDITFYMAPKISIGRSTGGVEMAGRPYAFVGMPIQMRNSTTGASSYWWNFGIGAGATPEQTPDAAPSVTYSTPGVKHITFLAYTPNGCEWTHKTRAVVMAYDPVIPSDVIIVRGDTIIRSTGSNQHIWVCPGGICRLRVSESYVTIYVEKGGSIVTEDFYESLLYLKEGASVIGVEYYQSANVIVHEEGVSFPSDDSRLNTVWDVPVQNLTFDYSNVPPGGCPSLAPYTAQIKQNTNSIHSPQNDDKSDMEYWVRDGGALTSTGSGNAFYVEAGGHVTINGSNGRIYLQDGASVNVQSGSNNRIFYEMQATIVNAGTDAVLLPSSGITFVNEVSSVGDDATAGESLIEIAPNPITDEAEIRIDPMLGRVRGVIIYDAIGNVVEERGAQEGTIRLSMEGYASGRYFVKIETERGTFNRSIIKE